MAEPRGNPHQSDVIVFCSRLITRLEMEHEDVLSAKRNVLKAALAAVAVTLFALTLTVVMAAVDPTRASISPVFWFISQTGTLLGLSSGSIAGALFLEYNKLEGQAARVSTQLQKVYELMLAVESSEKIEVSKNRDAARAKLADKFLVIHSHQSKDAASETKRENTQQDSINFARSKSG